MNTPNSDPNKTSSIGHKVEFWCGVVVGYEHQKEQLSNGNGWRYKVRIIGDNSDKDQIDDKDLNYADVLLSTDAGSGAAYKLRSARISQGDTVYGIKGPNIPTFIIGVEGRKRSTVLHADGKFKTLSGFYESLKNTNIISGEFNEQLGPATPGGHPYKINKSNRTSSANKLNEIGINPDTETGVIEDTIKVPPPPDITQEWEPGKNLTREKLFDIQEKTRNGELNPSVYLAAVEQAGVQNLVGDETQKKLINEANFILVDKFPWQRDTHTISGIEYDTETGLTVEEYNRQVQEEFIKSQTEEVERDLESGDFYQPNVE